jgi:hypothetical protein
VDRRLHGDEPGRRPVPMRDQRGAARRLLLHRAIRPASRRGRGRRRRRSARA